MLFSILEKWGLLGEHFLSSLLALEKAGLKLKISSNFSGEWSRIESEGTDNKKKSFKAAEGEIQIWMGLIMLLLLYRLLTSLYSA